MILGLVIISLISGCSGLIDGSIDVNIQDQHTPTIIFPLYEIINSGYNITTDTAPDSFTLELNNVIGLSIGDTMGIFQDTDNIRNYFGEIMNISGTTLTLDTEFESVFAVNKSPIVYEIETNINEDGSTNKIIHEFVNYGTIPMDVTRFVFTMQTTDPVDLNKFGDIIGGLERGCLLRERKADGTFGNIFNFKSNFDFVGVMFDFDTYDASHPNQGINGLSARLTLGSPGKIGVVTRLSYNESIQMVCKDDLTSLISFVTMLEGHLTDEPAEMLGGIE